MEMDSNPITKPSKKGTILSTVFYALAAVLVSSISTMRLKPKQILSQME